MSYHHQSIVARQIAFPYHFQSPQPYAYLQNSYQPLPSQPFQIYNPAQMAQPFTSTPAKAKLIFHAASLLYTVAPNTAQHLHTQPYTMPAQQHWTVFPSFNTNRPTHLTPPIQSI